MYFVHLILSRCRLNADLRRNGATVAIKGVKNEDDFQDKMFKEEIVLLQ